MITIKKQREKGRKDKTRTYNSKTLHFWHFLCVCVCVWLSRELSQNPPQQPKRLGHLWSSSSLLKLAILTPYWLLTAGRPSQLQVLNLTVQPRILGLTAKVSVLASTNETASWVLYDQRPWSLPPPNSGLVPSRRFTGAQLFV